MLMKIHEYHSLYIIIGNSGILNLFIIFFFIANHEYSSSFQIHGNQEY